MEKYQSRKDVPDKYKWDLSNFIKDENDYQEKIKYIKKNLPKLKEFVGCTKNGEKLYEFMEFDIAVSSALESLDGYTFALQDVDLANDKEKEKRQFVLNLLTQYSYESSFFTPELLSLSKEEYEALYKFEDLKKYKSYLDNQYRFKEHTRSEEEEKIVSLLTQDLSTYSNIQTTIINSCNNYGEITLEDGSVETLTLTNYRNLLRKSGREKRKEIYLKFQSVIRQYAPIFATSLNNYIQEKASLAKISKFESAWDQKMFALNLSTNVFNALTSAVEERKNLNVKYKNLRSKVLGIDDLMPWDNAVDMAKDTKEYTIEEAQELVLEALKPLGEDYIRHFKHIFESKSIDYCQYKGKRSGAYSLSSFNEHDSKILMSFNGNFSNVSTIAHEGGHHVNHQYICENNLPIYCGISAIVGEVASLTNEFLLSYYMSYSKDKDEALKGLSNAIDLIDNNIVGAVIEGNVERRMYEEVEKGGSLTTTFLDNLEEEELLKFSGDNKLKHEYQKNLWCLRNHYYKFFYLYSYSICASIASFVAKNIIDGNKEVLDNYLKFLKCGTDMSITDTYKILGVDLEDKKIYEEAMSFYDSLMDKFMEVKES